LSYTPFWAKTGYKKHFSRMKKKKNTKIEKQEEKLHKSCKQL